MGFHARTVRTVIAVAALVGGLGAMTACGSKPGWHNADGSPAASAAKEVATTIAAPANGATDVSTATEIGLANAKPGSTVTITDASGATVAGSMRADGQTWVPATQLKYATAYTATVEGVNDEASKVSFTTMAKPGKTINVSVAIQDGKTYGVAMPIVVRFGSDVAKDQRANIEKRLMVTSNPPQLGTWHWFSANEVHYRPKEYWQSGTTVSARLATGGLQMTSSAYGAKDVTSTFTIGRKLVLETDDATHQMTVTQDGTLLKTVPVSLGKSSTPSSSGVMVIMDKNKSEVFRGDASDPYVETVYYVQRTTIGGQYIHAAPWSEGDQGKRNVSHGCTNVSQDNAIWLYNLTMLGDPYTVKGTPRKLAWGDGWTDWDKPWEEYVKGSALPAPADPAASASSPAPSASASAPTN